MEPRQPKPDPPSTWAGGADVESDREGGMIGQG